MKPIVDLFPQILKFSQEYGLPITKKRAILREFLQTKILERIYQKKISSAIFFIGGTSLRLLYDSDRFSEDLDFDLGEITFKDISPLVVSLINEFRQENIAVDLYKNQTKKRSYFELRFPELLFQLGISRNEEEKLTIKLDFEKFWRGEKREVILLNRYGILSNVVTISLDQILVQKIYAYLQRKQTLARDLYDIVWLIAQGAKIDWKFVKRNHLPQDFVKKAAAKFQKEHKKLPNLKRKLIPFLVNEKNIGKIDFFPALLAKL